MYAHDLKCPVDPSRPEPPGICDACGAKWPLDQLLWQYDYAGQNLVNLRLRHCPRCLDEPQPQKRPPIIIGPDPVPVRDPRPPHYVSQAAGSGPQLPTKLGPSGGGAGRAGQLDFSRPSQSSLLEIL